MAVFSYLERGEKMDCRHEQIKSVNCVKYCLICGARLADCVQPLPKEGQEEKAGETQKKGVKRKRGEKA